MKYYQIFMTVAFDKNIPLKDSYEKISSVIRKFIEMNDGELKRVHRHKFFSNYTFSVPQPVPKDFLFKKEVEYQVELRSCHAEILSFRKYKRITVENVHIGDIFGGEMFGSRTFSLRTSTPLFIGSKRINDDEYEKEVIEDIKHNIFNKYSKTFEKEFEKNAFFDEVFENIEINRKPVGIPFYKKQNKNGNPITFFNIHSSFRFKNNELAKEVKNFLFCTGVGRMTSNGFGFLKEA